MNKQENINVNEIALMFTNSIANSGIKIESFNNDFKSISDFRGYLIQKLAEMLEKDFNGLINLLYRIDISENDLQELFSSQNKEYIPSSLADLIIRRQIQKINLRIKIKRDSL